tara:strand:- start:3296 stop:3979 length:684 start_codon:yes stop_codon:yes gene_type:complete
MNETGTPLYQLTLFVLSIYVLVALLAEAFIVQDAEIQSVLQYIDFGICLVFLADFFVNLYKAESRREYMRWGWLDFLSSIPAIDVLRWGRVSRIVRIVRYLRALRSIRILLQGIKTSRFETLTWSVFLIVFVSFTLSAAFILEFERTYGSTINTAESALWWAFLNIMNAKTSINQALSPEGIIITTVLNKIGFLVFAYLNSILVAWLVMQRRNGDQTGDASAIDCQN